MDDSPKPKGRGKPRDENLRDTILRAALELLLEKGFKGFTIEGVAARSGASKVTIYKWTKSKGTLALEAYVYGVSETIAFPQTDSARDDIENQLVALIEQLTTTPSGRAMMELMGAAQEDLDLKRELTARYIQPRRVLAARSFARLLGWDAEKRSEDLAMITDQVYGAIYNRILFGLVPLDRAFARRLIDFWAAKALPPV